jgi:hypothetical protein
METPKDVDEFNRFVFFVFMALTLTGTGFWIWMLGKGVVWLLNRMMP